MLALGGAFEPKYFVSHSFVPRLTVIVIVTLEVQIVSVGSLRYKYNNVRRCGRVLRR